MWMDYLGFLLRIGTVLAAILIVVGVISAAASRARSQPRKGKLQVEDLGERWEDLRARMKTSLMSDRKARKQFRKAEKKRRKAEKKTGTDGATDHQNAFVLDFKGDIQASQVKALSEAVSAVLAVARPGDTVLLRLESPGGVVHGYGLAASQLARLKKAGLTLWVSVDKVAASGGYMMASLADRIFAAPFAIVGSIGVVAQVPNVHRLLKKLHVDIELHTAGEFKRTLTVLGENTDEGRRKFKEDLEDTHLLFKRHIADARPALDVDSVANGDFWYGREAVDVGLVDELATSEDVVGQLRDGPAKRVLSVRYEPPKPLAQRLGEGSANWVENLVDRLLSRNPPL